MDNKVQVKKYSQNIVFTIVALLGLGFLTLYSVLDGALCLKQAILTTFAIGVVFVTFKVFDLKFFQEYSWLFYIANILLLLLLKFMGTTVLGAQRWIKLGPVSLQPSEFAKVFLIIFLAAWLSKYPIRSFIDIVKALVLIAIPSFLVLIQPDLGTTLVYLAICFGMLYWAGARLIELVILISPIVAAICSALNPVLFSYHGDLINFQIIA